MSKEMKSEEMDLELDLDDLEQVGGGGYLENLITRIQRSGKAPEYKKLLKTRGKDAAAAACCVDNPDLCGFCAAAVTMLK